MKIHKKKDKEFDEKRKKTRPGKPALGEFCRLMGDFKNYYLVVTSLNIVYFEETLKTDSHRDIKWIPLELLSNEIECLKLIQSISEYTCSLELKKLAIAESLGHPRTMQIIFNYLKKTTAEK